LGEREEKKRLIDIYEKTKLLSLLRSNPNCRWCPQDNCGYGNIGNPDAPEIICTECGYKV
jgi:hypothetical protein